MEDGRGSTFDVVKHIFFVSLCSTPYFIFSLTVGCCSNVVYPLHLSSLLFPAQIPILLPRQPRRVLTPLPYCCFLSVWCLASSMCSLLWSNYEPTCSQYGHSADGWMTKTDRWRERMIAASPQINAYIRFFCCSDLKEIRCCPLFWGFDSII